MYIKGDIIISKFDDISKYEILTIYNTGLAAEYSCLLKSLDTGSRHKLFLKHTDGILDSFTLDRVKRIKDILK